MSKPKQQSLISNIAYKFGLSFFKMVLPVIIMPYVYRQISPSDMGAIGYVLTIMSYFYVVGDFGYYIYGFRETILLKDDPKKLNTFFNQTFIVRTIMNTIALLCYILFIISNKSLDIPIVLYYAAGIQIVSTYFNVESFFEAIENFKFITLKTIIIRIISVVLIFMYVKDSSTSSSFNYLLILTCFLFVNNLVSFVFLLKSKIFRFEKTPSINLFYHLKRMAFIFIMINAVMLFFQLDKLIIGINGDLVGLSFYGLSEKTTLLTTSLLFSIITVVTPKLGNSLTHNKEAYRSQLTKVINTILILLFPTSFFLISSSSEILFILGGSEYLASKKLFQLFSVYIIAYTLLEVIKTNIFILIRKEKIYFALIITGGLINLILKFSFKDSLMVYDIMAITTIISFLIVIGLLGYVYKEFNFKIINNKFLKYLLIAMPILFLSLIEIDSEILSLFIKIMVSGLYYLIILILIKDEVLKEIISKILKR